VCYYRGMSTAPTDSTHYTCEVCNKTFNSQQEIEQHNKETHIQTAGQKE
jgi:stress-induced morphogen